MAITPEERHIDKKDEMQKERRRFLKKTVYAAPTIIALGGMLKPNRANANEFGGTPYDTSFGTDQFSANP